MSKYHLSFDKLHGVSAPAIVGGKTALVTKVRDKLNSKNLDANELCFITQTTSRIYMPSQ
jgi:hypothetical protein